MTKSHFVQKTAAGKRIRIRARVGTRINIKTHLNKPDLFILGKERRYIKIIGVDIVWPNQL
jgi:hypothetical protein